MASRKLLPVSLLAIFAAFSLYYYSASHVTNTVVPNPSDRRPFHRVEYLVNDFEKTNKVVIAIKEFHAEHFADNSFTTEDSEVLDVCPQAKAVLKYLREPMQAVAALGSEIDPSDCLPITRSLDTCEVWSISANTDSTTARPFLHTINSRVHRCMEALNRAAQQRDLLEQVTQTFVDNAELLPMHESGSGFCNLPGPRPDEDNTLELMREATFYLDTFRLFKVLIDWHLSSLQFREWNGKFDKEFVAGFREYLAGISEILAAVAARSDDDFAEGLSVLLRSCRKARSSHLY